METLPTHEITELLEAWNRGDEQALQKLTPIIYEELYRSAKRFISRGRPDNSIETTALINQLYVRMLDVKQVSWQNRAHFFAICARQMRSILVGFFRARHYQNTWRRRCPNEEMLWRAYSYYSTNHEEIQNRTNVSAHKRQASMGVIRLLKCLS